MRLTVGPLPSAVYWRRRAIVLGAIFVVLLVLFTTCRGGGGSGAGKTSATSTPTADAGEATSTPAVEASPTPPPATLAPTAEATTAAPPAGPTGAPAAPAAGACTDDEIKVTSAPSLTNAPAGQTIVIKLRIKNVSDRQCSRDVGPDEQEIYIKKGAETIWSSDRCSTYRGSEVKPFPRNLEMEFQVTWNGRLSTSCKDGMATGNAASPGQYEVFGRLGTDRSTAVKLTLT